MNKTQAKFWLFIVCAAFFLSPFYRTPAQMSGFVAEEIQVTRHALGDAWGGAIVKKAHDLFETAPVQATSLIFESATYNIKSEGNENYLYDKMSFQVGFKVMNKLIAGWGAMLFVMCIRFMIVASWLLVLLPMLFAAVVDGVGQRKIKYFNFRSLRPGTYTLLSMFVIPFAFSPLIYLVMPIAVSPAMVPLITSIMLLPLALLLANSQPVFSEK